MKAINQAARLRNDIPLIFAALRRQSCSIESTQELQAEIERVRVPPFPNLHHLPAIAIDSRAVSLAALV